MAISRKTNDAPKGVNLDHMKKLVERIEAKQSKAADARADLGSLFKEAEDSGLNRAALKLAIKLRNMEPDKRQDFLSSLNAYCDALGIFAQGDLFEDARAGVGAPSGETASDADPIFTARSAGFKDGAEGRDMDSSGYEDGSPGQLAYEVGWKEAQAAAVNALGGEGGSRKRPAKNGNGAHATP